jgi:hypothetical protein
VQFTGTKRSPFMASAGLLTIAFWIILTFWVSLNFLAVCHLLTLLLE